MEETLERPIVPGKLGYFLTNHIHQAPLTYILLILESWEKLRSSAASQQAHAAVLHAITGHASLLPHVDIIALNVFFEFSK